MYLRVSLLALSLPLLAAAQIYGPAPGPASPTTSASSAPAVPTAPADTPGFMNIDVAFQETFTFNPASITAPIGTIVTFYFPANGLSHSVTQSSFAQPCTWLAPNDTAGTSGGGFDSGLQQGVQFSINITDDTVPIWFHCKQVQHCGMGMVGSINAPADGTNTFAAFQAAAMAIGANEVTETDNGPVTGGVGALATATPANTATSAAAASSQPSSSGAGHVVVSAVSGILAVTLSIAVLA